MLLSFATAVAVTFTISEITTMSGNKVVFTTLTAPTVSLPARPGMEPNRISIGESALSVFFGTDEIVVGSAAALTAPRPNAELVLMPRKGWQESISQRILESAAARSLFPSKTLGIAMVGSEATLAGYSEIMELVAAIHKLNAQLGGQECGPIATYFFDVHSRFVGVN